MSSFNKVIQLGNLTRDVETRYTPKGTAVANGALAVNRKWKSESGEQKEEVAFIDFKAFGRRAEVIAQYTRKGLALLIEGYLKQESWTDKQTGQGRSKLVVIVENFSLIDFADRAEDNRPTPSKPRGQTAAEQVKAAAADDDDPPPDDDVPF